ncbi:MAG: hypothetical protein K9N23_12000 [Akkermansiaceae bacterium]|nr:hypothetical protein [Akkermansiaceae bacterium]
MNLDNDVLEMARMLAAKERKPLGAVISAMLRHAVEPAPSPPRERNGIPLFPVSRGARAVTPEMVKELLDEVP